MSAWLLKTEPEECSIDTIRAAPGGVLRWDGIRNYQARNFLRDGVAAGDTCLVYHSAVRAPAIVGEAVVARAAYADPAQFDPESPYFDPKSPAAAPRWLCIDIRYAAHWHRPVTLEAIRAMPALAGILLVRQGRLSVQPVTDAELACLRRAGGGVSA